MREISKTEQAIKDCYSRVLSLEKKIESDKISDAKKDMMRRELLEVRKLLLMGQTFNMLRQNRVALHYNWYNYIYI
ncbi:hypothetical protein Zmor_006476 [Zophobas morio]|uniref:Uncharacterized protein n=1 Tax=Zophobas morio TaxID=2755281 RepID=A0AA38ISD8_9CUCU|nr:hypothetical protein Zmor_006476 [Zophobas morio]